MDKALTDPVEFIRSIADDLGVPGAGDPADAAPIDRVARAFGFDIGFVYIVNAALGEELYLSAWFDDTGALEFPKKIESTRAADAAAGGESDFAAHLIRLLFARFPNEMSGSVSLLSGPIFEEDRIIGVAGIASSEGVMLDEEETSLARAALSMIGANLRAGYSPRLKGCFKDSLERAIDSAGVDIYVVDYYTHEILYMNKSMAEPYGTPEEMLGKKCYEALYQDQVGECDFCPRKMLTDEDGNPTKRYSWDYQRPFDGSWFRGFSAAFVWEGKRLAHVVTSTNITENKKNEFLVEKMAMNDALTDIPNRRSFERDFDKVIGRALRGNKTGFILFIDLDNFKHINDAFGHEKGDELLIRVASYLDGFSNERQQVYRYGGDEFIILIEDIEYGTLSELVDLFLFRFTESWDLDGLEYFCTASIGVASFPADGATYDVLLNAADKAMYEAKKQGKSTAVYSCGEAERESKEMEFEFALRRAVLDGCREFEVLFHPIVDIHTGEWAGVEALARWNSQIYGTVAPDRFIPVCERLSLIFDLERWLFASALREVVSWDLKFPDFFLSFNVSAMEFYGDEFTDFMFALAEEHSYPHYRLMLEIADSAANFCLDIGEIKTRLDNLRSRGVAVALDGFGIGYNSLERIQGLSVDFIKIDRKFVADFLDDDIKVAVVKAIVMLARAARAKVCAEGVESQGHFDCLKSVGCDYVQGSYYFAPAPGEEILEAILKNRNGQGDIR